jgi:hypothetical protein
VSFEERDRERHRRIEKKQDEFLRRMAAAEKRCEDAEAERVRQFEAAEGRMMTRAEKLDAAQDGLLLKINATTLEFLRVMHDFRDDMKREFAESHAEARAGHEAMLRILDRLPPPRDAS